MSMRFCLPRACWLIGAFALIRGVAAGQVTPPVSALECACQDGGNGKPLARLFWINPQLAGGFSIEIRREEIVVAVVPGEQPGGPQSFVDVSTQIGVHVYEVTVIDKQGQTSERKRCNLECVVQPQLGPRAHITGPQRLVMPPAGIAEAIYDGRGSRDDRGAQALRYEWRVTGLNGVEVQSPASFITRVRFGIPGSYIVELFVAQAPDFQKPDRAQVVVEVLPPGVIESPEFFPLDPQLLVAVVGRPIDIPLVAVKGLQFQAIQILVGPPGIKLLPERGKLIWIPPPEAAGQEVPVVLALAGPEGNVTLSFAIRVLDSGEPLLMYAFPPPKKAGGAGAGGIEMPGDGGGGTLSSAPLVLEDQSLAQPSLGLQLSLGAPETCAVQLVTAGGGDAFDGLLFQPGCAGAASSGLYFTGSSADKVMDDIVSDFTIELWVSQVSAAVPPGGRAFIFSMSSGTADINWLVAHDGGSDYTVSVRVNGAQEELSVSARPRADGLTNLVFVRSGNTHAIYVNGRRSAGRNVPPANPVDASWDSTQQVLLGSSSDESRPFSGRVHLSAIYPEALSDALIGLLDQLGPRYPTDEPIPPPIADICPDPREIRRVDADGSESRSQMPDGNGGGGEADPPLSCPSMLRPFQWTLTSLDPLIPASWEPEAGEEDCKRRIRILYDEPPSGVRFDLKMKLEVTQVPVRGVVAKATKEMTIRLPSYFKRGDVNLDDSFDISDGITVLLSLFSTLGPLPCDDAADANDDDRINSTDAVFMFRALFLGGTNPRAPYPACGADPWSGASGADALGCHDFPFYCAE